MGRNSRSASRVSSDLVSELERAMLLKPTVNCTLQVLATMCVRIWAQGFRHCAVLVMTKKIWKHLRVHKIGLAIQIIAHSGKIIL